jgi:hypothetical protein
MRLVGEKTALVAVEVALSKNAMMNRTAAINPSMTIYSRSLKLLPIATGVLGL